MPREATEPVEGTDDRVLASVAGLLPKLPNVRAEDPDRFAQAIRGLVEARAQAGWPGEGSADVAAFIMVDRPREIAAEFETQAIMDPIATIEGLLGRLFLMTRDGASGRHLVFPCDPGDLLEWLSEHGLGDRPLVVAYRGTRTLTVRREGIDDLTRAHRIRDHPPTATVPELLDALNQFHLERLLTPGYVTGVWERGRAGGYVPGPQPERSIQAALEFALNFWFHGVVKAEIEDTTKIGRIDVRLLKASVEGPLTYWAIVELKVIKSFVNAAGRSKPAAVSRSTNVKGVVEGLRQAWAYRQNRTADEGLLEIFDLRRDKSEDLMTDPTVAAVLGELEPTPLYQVRPLFGSAQHARQAGFSG